MIYFVNNSEDRNSLKSLSEAAEFGSIPAIHAIGKTDQQSLIHQTLNHPDFLEIHELLQDRGHNANLSNSVAFSISSGANEAGFMIVIPYSGNATLQFLSIAEETSATGLIHENQLLTLFQTGESSREILIPELEERRTIVNKVKSTPEFQAFSSNANLSGFDIHDEDAEIALDLNLNKGSMFLPLRGSLNSEATILEDHQDSEDGTLIDFDINQRGEPIITHIGPAMERDAAPVPSPDGGGNAGGGGGPIEIPPEVEELFVCVKDCVSSLTQPTRPILPLLRVVCASLCEVCALSRFPPLCLPCAGCIALAVAGGAACLYTCIDSQRNSGDSIGSALTPE